MFRTTPDNTTSQENEQIPANDDANNNINNNDSTANGGTNQRTPMTQPNNQVPRMGSNGAGRSISHRSLNAWGLPTCNIPTQSRRQMPLPPSSLFTVPPTRLAHNASAEERRKHMNEYIGQAIDIIEGNHDYMFQSSETRQ